MDSGVSSIVGALSDFSVANLTSIIVAGLGVAVPLILLWAAYRFVFRKAKGGLKSGR